MENPQLTIWEANPKLKMLLLILIFVFLFSGIGLVVFAQWSNSYREKVYEDAQAGLPVHKITEQATTTSQGQLMEVSDYSVVDSQIPGWKTYSGRTAYSDQEKFSVDYPDTWSVIQSRGGYALSKRQCAIDLGAGGHGLEGTKLIKTIEVKSENGLIGKGSANDIGGSLEAFIGFNGDYLFELYRPTVGSQDCYDEFLQIVKTFKILNP